MDGSLTLEMALLVLLAALLHAGWNAMVKGGGDPVLDLALMFGGSGLIAVTLMPFVPMPASESWPWLAASAVVHLAYAAMLTLTYRTGDLSHVYPLMRGTPLMIVAGITSAWVGDRLGAGTWAGITLISGGLLSLGIGPRTTWRATVMALLTASTTATYTIIDGMGARASGASESFVLWILAATSLPLTLAVAVLRGRAFANHARRYWRRGIVSGGAGMLAYGIVLWAMAHAPIAAVAALRETSVVFAALLGAFWLREPVGRRRAAAALAVATGAAVLKLA